MAKRTFYSIYFPLSSPYIVRFSVVFLRRYCISSFASSFLLPFEHSIEQKMPGARSLLSTSQGRGRTSIIARKKQRKVKRGNE